LIKSSTATPCRQRGGNRLYVLREAIVTNTLKPGTRLRADDLAKRLGVSKTPVREALRKLQAENLIIVSPAMR